MKLISNIVAMCLMAILLNGCGPGGMNNQTGGAIAGGGLGALLGSRFGKGSGRLAATGLGAVLGGVGGGMVGSQMDGQGR